MRSRSTWKTADGLFLCSILHSNSDMKRSLTTMRSRACLSSWGVTLEKDLILDLNPLGQIAGLGPQVALVTSYGSQPIVDQLRGTATGFPLARSLEIKNTDKTSVQKLFDSSEHESGDEQFEFSVGERERSQEQEGATDAGGRGHFNTGKENSQGRFVVVGTSTWAANRFIDFNGNNDLASNAVNWLSSDEDLISIRPKQQEDRRITMTGRQFSWVEPSANLSCPLRS